MFAPRGRRPATPVTRHLAWRAVLLSAAVTVLSACSSVAPISLPLPSRNDSSATDTQARVAATAVPIQQPAEVTALATRAATREPTPAPTVAPGPQPQLVAVQRGSIDEVAQFDGQIVPADQVPIAFSGSGTVASVAVAVGQTVSAGDDLVVEDPGQLQQSISDIQARIDTANARSQLAQTQLSARQQDAQKTAMNAVQAAQDNLAKVQAGASQSDRQAADAGVLAAQNALDKAQADLAKLQAPATETDLQVADGKVADAQLRLRDAQAAKAKLLAGPDPATLQAAQRDLANAQDAQSNAQADLDALMSGPDPFALRAAQRDVDRAQAGVAAAQSMRVSSSSGFTQDQKDQAVKNADFALQDAQDRLAQLKQPPKPAQIDAATSKLDAAKRAVASVQDKVNILTQPPDQLSIDHADGTINDAQVALDGAKAAAAALRIGPTPDQLRDANNAIQSAQMQLQAAQTHRDEVYGHPTSAELQPAQQQLADAQAQLARTQQSSTKTDPSAGDVLTQQSDIAQMHDQLAALQASLDATHLRAPFDGTVVSISVHAGDSVAAGKPIVTMAHVGQPLVSVTLPATTVSGDTMTSNNPASRVATGQSATVQIDGGDGSVLDGSVAGVSTAADGTGRVAQLQVDWSNQTPTLGGTALVRVVVQHKDNALLVPASAVHSLGTRKTVDVMVGTERRSVTVDTGIVGDKQIEVLDGLTDGQQILSGLSVVSPSASASPDASSIAAAPTIASALTPTPAQIAPAQVAPAQLAAARPTAPIASGASAPGATALPAGSDATTDTVRQPLFEDHFTDSLQGWSDKTAIGAWIQPDGYHLEPRSAGQFLAVGAPISSVPSDVEVTARLHKSGGPSGGGYGIIVRDQEPLSGVHSQTGAFYVLEVGDGGDVGIWRRDGDHWAELMPWTHSDAVQPGSASNELTARAVGQQLTFLVNGQVVATRQDATLPTGRVGLFVGGDGNQVIAEQFIVRPI